MDPRPSSSPIGRWASCLKDTPLQDGERAAIYLTNALTGWAESEAGPAIPGYEALVEERSAATAIKRERPILVVLGNPPYNAYAGPQPRRRGRPGGRLQERLAGRLGREKSRPRRPLRPLLPPSPSGGSPRAPGAASSATSATSSWVSLPSFTVMRQSLLASFDRIWVENLHGDRTITEYGAGRPQQARPSSPLTASRRASGRAWRRRCWSEPGRKRSRSTATGTTSMRPTRRSAGPTWLRRWTRTASTRATRCWRRPRPTASCSGPVSVQSAGYATWPALDTLAKAPPLPGLLEKRGGGLVSMDKATLVSKMRAYPGPGAQLRAGARRESGVGGGPSGLCGSEGSSRPAERRFCAGQRSPVLRVPLSTRAGLTRRPRRPCGTGCVHRCCMFFPTRLVFLALRPQQIADPEGLPRLLDHQPC